LEKSPSREELKILWGRNWATVRMLKANFPNLMSDRYKRYSDLLILLYDGSRISRKRKRPPKRRKHSPLPRPR
jgi:hypothetical protein